MCSLNLEKQNFELRFCCLVMVFYTKDWTIWTVRLKSFTGFLDCNLNNFLVLQSCFINKSNLFFKITFGHLVLDFVLVAHLYIMTPCCCPYLKCQLHYTFLVYVTIVLCESASRQGQNITYDYNMRSPTVQYLVTSRSL